MSIRIFYLGILKFWIVAVQSKYAKTCITESNLYLYIVYQLFISR